MTDIAQRGASPVDWTSSAADGRRRRRRAAETRLRYYGLAAIAVALGLLAILVGSLVLNGYRAFTQTQIALDVYVDPAEIDVEDPSRGDYRGLVAASIASVLPGADDAELRAARDIVTRNVHFILRDHVVRDPSVIGETIRIQIPASDPFDQLAKGIIDRDLPESRRRVNDQGIAIYDQFAEQGRVEQRFNAALFFNADSRFPELAGLSGAVVGSFFALVVCFVLSFPIGIAAAVYLEEFAPKNKWTDIVEVNINNLAAVPSIVFGLLGLAIFLGWFGMPRSAPLVGGMVLALMTLPTMIIVTRAALKAVPPSIREAALGVGASKHEVVMHHVLPLALPGILTGTIIGLAQALGETAPLLLIGMNAFITSPPGGLLEPATALPTQIFIWADSPERGFVARTSAGILVLLGFLILMNLIAIFLRNRLERKW
ncbi:phosphate ABC transporter permease PstA [Salinarimonas chemoclinalis]|uniref:phosphate ABC transporter permease PstA n=1 Tax=Salinarimonas chemoclinalis TaxID=3241599 RepID=UPI003555F39D